MKTKKGKALMLIIPVVLLAVLIFVYRDYEMLHKDSEDVKPTQSPAAVFNDNAYGSADAVANADTRSNTDSGNYPCPNSRQY